MASIITVKAHHAKEDVKKYITEKRKTQRKEI